MSLNTYIHTHENSELLTRKFFVNFYLVLSKPLKDTPRVSFVWLTLIYIYYYMIHDIWMNTTWYRVLYCLVQQSHCIYMNTHRTSFPPKSFLTGNKYIFFISILALSRTEASLLKITFSQNNLNNLLIFSHDNGSSNNKLQWGAVKLLNLPNLLWFGVILSIFFFFFTSRPKVYVSNLFLLPIIIGEGLASQSLEINLLISTNIVVFPLPFFKILHSPYLKELY